MNLLIPEKKLSDKFKLEDFQRDFNVIDLAVGKLQEGLETVNTSLNNIKTYITPEMFGAKGDGIADDTASIQTAITYAINNKKVLKFKGKYTITSQIIVNDAIEIDLNGSEIIANYRIPNVFYFKKENGSITGAKIRNGVINCNDVADNGINIYRATGGFYCDDIRIIKPLKCGVVAGTENKESSYEIMINRLTIDRESGSKYPSGSYGVYLDNVTDSRITDTIIVGVENGVYANGGGNEFIAVHVWNRPSNGFMKIGFDVYSDIRLISCYADSSEVAFNIRGTGNTLIAPKIYVNTYGDANGTNYPLNPICFDFHKESGKGNTIIGLVVGSGGDNGSLNFTGCKRNGEYQTFIGSRYTSGFSYGSDFYYPVCFRKNVEFKNKTGNNEIRVHEDHGFQVNSLNPLNDNTIDIGTYQNRFKNIFLSGGVRIGSTSSENRPMYGSDVKYIMHYDYNINRYIMWDGSKWQEIPFDDVRHGNGSPWFTPLRIGQEYYDLQNKKLYKSFGTTMSDWVIVN